MIQFEPLGRGFPRVPTDLSPDLWRIPTSAIKHCYAFFYKTSQLPQLSEGKVTALVKCILLVRPVSRLKLVEDAFNPVSTHHLGLSPLKTFLSSLLAP
jgi:hypothetical protein